MLPLPLLWEVLELWPPPLSRELLLKPPELLELVELLEPEEEVPRWTPRLEPPLLCPLDPGSLTGADGEALWLMLLWLTMLAWPLLD